MRNVGFWAKAWSDSDVYHPLVAHSADVAAMLRELLADGSVLRDRLQQLADVPDVDPLARTLVHLATLHDLGKTNHGFQDKAGPWARPERAAHWRVGGHVTPVIATFSAVPKFKDVVRDILAPLQLPPEAQLPAFVTTICHHGQPLDRANRNLPRAKWSALWELDPRSGRDPQQELQRLARLASEWSGVQDLPENGPDVGWNNDVSNLFAGILTVADWLGSNTTFFPPDESAESNPTRYWERATARAGEVLGAVGITTPRPTSDSRGTLLYRELFPRIFQHGEPTPLQDLTASVALPSPGSRIVVEAETGSGKTEAVLALYFRLRAAGRVEGLVFALPTRATATAMYDRIAEVAARLADPGHTPTIALAMGGQVASAPRPEFDPASVQQHPDEQDRLAHGWASENSKTFFGAEIVIGTVDQVLLAGLPVRHAHLRLALLSRHLIVIDELHAYDRYMNGILANVIDFHSRAGGIATFVSATLSRSARFQLVKEDDPSTMETAASAPYPLLSVRERSADRWDEHPAPIQGHGRPVEWSVGSEEEGLAEAIALARTGARVCVLRNTVKDARRTVSRLHEQVPELLWRPSRTSEHRPAYHSRYTLPDRRVLDEAALRDFGKSAGRDGTGLILVSTQVAEQSLDVDFDWMLTDLAPIDVLLQRIGRVHRHDRDDRAQPVRQSRVRIHAPTDPFEASPDRKSDFGWGTVYNSWLDLELTRQLIVHHESIRIPEDNRRLVEAVYHAESRETFTAQRPEWSTVLDHDEGIRLGREVHASLAALGLDRSYPDQAEQYRTAREESIRTRLGDDRIQVSLNRPVRAWYASGHSSDSMVLSMKDLVRAQVDDLVEPTAEWHGEDHAEQQYRLGERGLISYTPQGWKTTVRSD